MGGFESWGSVFSEAVEKKKNSEAVKKMDMYLLQYQIR